MTLCAAWRENGKVKFAADSRISFGGAREPFDGAIKITPMRMELDLLNPHCLSEEKYFHGNIGTCFAGSVLSSFVLKDTFLHAWKGWVIQDFRDIPSFDLFIAEAFRHYKSISQEICRCLAGPQGLAAVAIAGFCFKENRYVVYLFEPAHDGADYSSREIIKDDGDVYFFGTGKDIADDILKQESTLCSTNVVVGIINKIISLGLEPSVGGRVQIGEFNSTHSFTTTIPGIPRARGC